MANGDLPSVLAEGDTTSFLEAIAPPTVLAIAGSDPSGGAGIQADLATVAAHGLHGGAAVTALTVQDTTHVHDFRVEEADWVVAQVRAVLRDLPVAAIKVGMLGSAANARALADLLADHPDIPAVIDPVQAAAAGDSLAEDSLGDALCGALLPRATVVTPNADEAHQLTGETVAEAQADALLGHGAHAVLLKGGHRSREDAHITDRLFFLDQDEQAFRHPRLPDRGYHGSGCTLSTAIACALASGDEPAEAVRAGLDFTFQALRAAYYPGQGQAVPDRHFRWRPEGWT
jgi:hydroxymethylpyrimidine/phosphomethylpyrimidine kinase